MADVNKNIIDAYKSMYEPKEEVLDETNKNDKSDDGEGLDAVQPDAVKKKFKDRKDKDIDNDGDVDSSDEYLHKRRKAVSKAISNEEDENGEEVTEYNPPNRYGHRGQMNRCKAIGPLPTSIINGGNASVVNGDVVFDPTPSE